MVKKFAKQFLYALAWVLWLVFCYFLSQILIFVTLDLLPIEVRDDDTILLAVISALVYAVTLVILVLVPWSMRTRLKLSSKLTELVGASRKVVWSDLGKALASFALYLLVLIGVMSLFAFVFPDLSDQEQSLGFAKTGNSFWQLALIFVSLVIIPPICEEMIMRGFLFGRLRQKLPFWVTAVIVSLVFSVAHGQVNVAIDTFVLSLFLCSVREKTGAIWAPIIVHMLKNLLGFILVFVMVV
jgi:membrane protease YdiL (CAAX protease family)